MKQKQSNQYKKQPPRTELAGVTSERTTPDCCKDHPNIPPTGRVSVETERFGGKKSISIRLRASHPCGITAYSVSVSSDVGGGMRDRFLREDVLGIDCDENKDLEVSWRVGPSGSGKATTNVKGKPTTESTFLASGPAADLEGRELTAIFEVTSCCNTKAQAEIRIGAITFRPPITERKNLT